MDITPEIVRELLHYDPETGIFTWRERSEHWFKDRRAWKIWNTKHAGERAGYVWTGPKTGYQRRDIRLFGRPRLEHRLAWMWMTDEPLPPQIDHENRDATDNRWLNLRASEHAKNGRNQSMSRNNTSGITGVCWDGRRGKWQAQCQFKGKNHNLGRFADRDEAARAVSAFRAEHGFDPGHGASLAHYCRREVS